MRERERERETGQIEKEQVKESSSSRQWVVHQIRLNVTLKAVAQENQEMVTERKHT